MRKLIYIQRKVLKTSEPSLRHKMLIKTYNFNWRRRYYQIYVIFINQLTKFLKDFLTRV